MALKLDERYPGRANPPSIDYPQGSFKNRTSPDSKDGTYLEQDWANDQQGFFQSLLSGAGVSANGKVDKVGSSQYFDALKTVVRGVGATETASGVARIATSAEAAGFTNDTKIITSKKLNDAFLQNRSFSTTYARQVFPGGGILMCGHGITDANGGVTITFKNAFPTACVSMNATPITTHGAFMSFQSLTRTSCFFQSWRANAVSEANVEFNFIAFGY